MCRQAAATPRRARETSAHDRPRNTRLEPARQHALAICRHPEPMSWLAEATRARHPSAEPARPADALRAQQPRHQSATARANRAAAKRSPPPRQSRRRTPNEVRAHTSRCAAGAPGSRLGPPRKHQGLRATRTGLPEAAPDTKPAGRASAEGRSKTPFMSAPITTASTASAHEQPISCRPLARADSTHGSKQDQRTSSRLMNERGSQGHTFRIGADGCRSRTLPRLWQRFAI